MMLIQGHLEHIRKDIREFKEKHSLETVIVLWTANTERYTDENCRFEHYS